GATAKYQFGPMVGTDWQKRRDPAPDVTANDAVKTKLKLVVTVTKGNMTSITGNKEMTYEIRVPTGSGSGSVGGGGSGGGSGAPTSNTEVSSTVPNSLLNPQTAVPEEQRMIDEVIT